MDTYAALLRGINVGGHRILPMKELRAVLEELGLRNVRTYVQSGNVVFQSGLDDRSKLSRRIGNAIEASHGFTPEVLVLTAGELEAAIGANPFPEADQDPKTLHLYFARSTPVDPDVERLESLLKPGEGFELIGDVCYFYAPDGIARSRAAAGVERALGVAGTARNWRSVNAVMAMVREVAAIR